MHIPRTEVKSSLIEAIGYHADTQTLDICFKPRKPGAPPSVYRYQHIPAKIHSELVNAESIGKHFGEGIFKLPGTYPYRKLSPEEINPPE